MAEEVSLAESSADVLEVNDKVRQLEEMFKDRYTENDEAYMKTVATPLPDPPCVKNWFVRQRGNWNRGGRGGHRGSGDRRYDDRYGNRGGYRGNRDSYHGNRDNYYGNQRQYQGHSYGGDSRQRYDNYGQHGNRGRDDRRYHPY